ncbi:MAG: FHA domain-containing protein [Kofleriaceae bacterium]|nr:FHA domain-containing protein [Kofleriaceae bacterium]
MFAILITEKGGEQRRIVFNKPEVTIGRVQGNDIVLPKGNVSKRHARIVLKDGKFIIVDLKSTNGTYVNGRKITSPLVVKEADKIYIGDFIMGVEDGRRGAPDARRGQLGEAPPPRAAAPRAAAARAALSDGGARRRFVRTPGGSPELHSRCQRQGRGRRAARRDGACRASAGRDGRRSSSALPADRSRDRTAAALPGPSPPPIAAAFAIARCARS